MKEYRFAFPDFEMPNVPLSDEEDFDSEGNELRGNGAERSSAEL